MPFLGVWYIIFITQFMIYGALDAELHIEEQFAAAGQEETGR